MEQFFQTADHMLAHLTFLFLAIVGAARLLIQEIGAVRIHKKKSKKTHKPRAPKTRESY
jgi:hypothetical protein